MAVNISVQETCIPLTAAANIQLIVFTFGETYPLSYNYQIRRASNSEVVYNNTFTFNEAGSQQPPPFQLSNDVYNVYDNGGFLVTSFTIDCIDTPPCDLTISNTVGITNDSNGQGTGTITLSHTSSFIVEFRLLKDGIEVRPWQSSNVFTGLTSGTYVAEARDSNDCEFTKGGIVISNVACSLTVTGFATHETETLNNGTITGSSSGGIGTVLYSLNNGTYQASASYSGLGPGVYTLYAKDTANCIASINITVNAFIPEEEPPPPEEIPCFDPVMVFPETLPYRFVTRHCNDDDDLDKLYAENEHCGVYAPCYFQPLSCNDVFTMQFYYLDAEYETVPVLVFKNFTTQLPLYTLEFTSLGSGYYKIEKNVSEMAVLCGKRVYLEVQSYHTVAEENLFTHAVSEPLKISNNHNCNILLEYWNDSNFDEILYENTGYINHLRLEAIFDLEETPQEDEVYVKSNGERVSIFSSLHEVWNLEVGHAPTYLHKKIALALSHQHIRINGREYVKEEPYSYDRIEKFALRKGEGKLVAKTYQSKNLIK